MNKQSFYTEIKNNWEKILPHLTLPKGYFISEINRNFYVFEKKEDMEYVKSTLGGDFSSYSSKSLLSIAGEPYNDNSRILILIATKTIYHWKNNSASRDKALMETFGHLAIGIEAMGFFNDYLPNRYGLILKETISN